MDPTYPRHRRDANHSKAPHSKVEELARFEDISVFSHAGPRKFPPLANKSKSPPPPSTGSVTDASYRVFPQTDSPDTVNAFEQLNFIHFQSFTSLLLPTRIFGASPAQRKNRINSGPMCFRCGTTRAFGRRSILSHRSDLLPPPVSIAFGPDARGILESIVLLPQGVDGGNLGWLFRRSSTHLAYLPKSTEASCSLRCSPPSVTTSDLSTLVHPSCSPRGRNTISEDLNVEHLLDVSMSPQAEHGRTWTSCDTFLDHYRHESRPVDL